MEIRDAPLSKFGTQVEEKDRLTGLAQAFVEHTGKEGTDLEKAVFEFVEILKNLIEKNLLSIYWK